MVRAYFGAKEMILFEEAYYSPRHLYLREWMWGSIFSGLHADAVDLDHATSTDLVDHCYIFVLSPRTCT